MGRRLETKVAEFLGWKNLQPDFSACRNFHLRLDWMLIPHYLCLWFCIEVEPDDVGWGCSRCPLAIEGHWVVLKGFHDMLEKSESLDARQWSQRVRFVMGTVGCIHGWPHLLCVDVEEIARENVGKLSQSEVTKRCAAEKCPLSALCLPYEGLRKAHGERFTCCLFVTSRGDGEDPFSKMPKARMESRGHKLATRNSHLTSSSFQAIPSLDDSEGSGGTWRSLPTSLPCVCTHACGHLCNVCSYICNVEGHRLSLGTLHLAELVGSEAEWAIPTNIYSMQGLHPGGVCIGADRKHKNHGGMREDGYISDEHRVMSGDCTRKGRENPLSRPAWGPGVLSLLAELWGCLYDIHTFRHHSWWLYRSLQLN